MKTRAIKLLVILAQLCLGCSSVLGQTSAATTKIHAGYRFDMLSRSRSESYYKVEWLGRRLFDRGSPFSFTSHDAIMPPFEFGRNPGDHSWNVRFENGTVAGEGGLLESAMLSSINLAGLRDVMGAAYVAGADDFNDLTFSIGLALPGTFLSPRQARSLSNTFLVTVAAERRESSDSDQDTNLGVLAGKARLAIALSWSKSAKLIEPVGLTFNAIIKNTGSASKARKHVQDKIIEHAKENLKSLATPFDEYTLDDESALRLLPDFVEESSQTPSLERLLANSQQNVRRAANDETDISKKEELDREQEYLRMLYEVWNEVGSVGDHDERAWYEHVTVKSGIIERVKSYFPTLSVFAEGSAWMPITRSSAFGNRPLGLVTAGIDYYPSVSRNDMYLRFAVEVGYERANPSVRKSNLLIATAFRF